MKIIKHSSKAKILLRKGFNKLAKAVAVTLGPSGRTVILQKEGLPVITKDGVSVAKEVYLSDPISNMGAELLRQVSLNTNHQAGDGTTTATVLAKSILDEGFRMIEEGDISPIEIKRQLDKDLELVKDKLKEEAILIKDNETLKQVLKVSTNNDEELATLIASVFDKVGNSTILLEQSPTAETYGDVLSGMYFNSTYADRFFINNHADNTCVLERPAIMICEGKVDDKRSFLRAIDLIASKTSRPLVLITENVTQDILLTLLANQQSGKLQSVIINSPGFGPGREEQLHDIAIFTGAEVIRKGMLKEFSLKNLGTADSIVVGEEITTITEGGGNKEEIANRIEDLKYTASKKDQYTKDKLLERASKFEGGIGVIYIGALSEIEYKEKYDRVEDAKNAGKAALEEGIIPGGGTTLFEIGKSLREDSILHLALQAPYKQIVSNMGIDVEFTKEDCIAKDIYDPVRVTKIALENAVSVAGTILTTECVIANK